MKNFFFDAAGAVPPNLVIALSAVDDVCVSAPGNGIRAVVPVNKIRSIGCTECVVTPDHIIPRPAGEDIIVFPSPDGIFSVSAEYDVFSLIPGGYPRTVAVQVIVTLSAENGIITLLSKNHIVICPAVKGVAAVPAVDPVTA